MKVNGYTPKQLAQARWVKRMSMEPVEAPATTAEAFEVACQKIDRLRLQGRVGMTMDEIDHCETRHG